jgi:hypothetical protein
MKKLLTGITLALGLAFLAPKAHALETIKPLHPSVQIVLTSTTYTGAVSSTTASVDLSGGDLTSISCAYYIGSASSTGTPTLDAAIQISPDGGTNWTTAGSFTQQTSTATATVNGKTFVKQDVSTGPGTKARILFTGAANTSWIGVKAWCLPTVD